MTKKISTIFCTSFFILSFFALFISCDDDDSINDSENPGIPEFTSEISSAPGLTFIIQGVMSDETGIEKINIYYPKWYLDKNIEFDEAPKEYSLNYSFLAPADEERGSVHTIKVTLTDLGGNEVSKDVVVTLNYDDIKPAIEVISPTPGISVLPGEEFNLNVDFSDNEALDSIKVLNSGLGLNTAIKMEAGTTNYKYEESVIIPEQNPANSYDIAVIAIDANGNQVKKSITVLVGEAGRYTNMYTVGDSMQYPSDPEKAVQMWLDPADENWFVVEFYYWTGYGIAFIGQLDWEPNYWGQDPDNANLVIKDPNSSYINFPDGDGYYRVRFNPYTSEYTYEKMTVNIEVRSEMYIMGSGYPDYPELNWNPDKGIPMDADEWGNPYVFEKVIRISNDTSLKFLGQNTGWGPYDCGFEEGGEYTIPVNFVKNKAGDGSADIKLKNQEGWYRITFDYFLLRTTIQPYNP